MCVTGLFVRVFVLHPPPRLCNSWNYAVGIITASLANDDNGAGDLLQQKKRMGQGAGGGERYGYR